MVAILFALGCKPTAKDALEAYRPRFEALSAALTRAAGALPKPGAFPPSSEPLDPPVVCTGDEHGNTDLLSVGEVAQPDYMQPLYPSFIMRGLGYLRTPPLGITREQLKQPAEAMKPELEAMVSLRYAVIYQIVERFWPAPAAGGRYDVDAFVIDVKSGEIKREVRILALTPPAAPYDELEDAAHDQLLDALAQKTGGTFSIARKRKAPAADPFLSSLARNDPNAAAPLLLPSASAEERVVANVKLAGELIAHGQSAVNVCRSVLVMSRLNRLTPAVAADAERTCGVVGRAAPTH
jgi:hypothetical protein